MAQDSSPIRLGTMGMFIIDSFRFFDAATRLDLGNKCIPDQIGGGGCYFAIGARMWLHKSDIQMIVDRGCDWTSDIQAVLDRYDHTPSDQSSSTRSMWYYRSRPDATTRAVNVYTGEQRGFHYLSAKIRLEPMDLLKCSPLIPPRLPQWIHMICSPQRALETLSQIEQVRTSAQERGYMLEQPHLLYEPIPDSCIFTNLPDCIQVAARVAVFSPNHDEAASLLGLTNEWNETMGVKSGDDSVASEARALDFIELRLAHGFVELLRQGGAEQSDDAAGFGPIICIRSGAWGCVVGRGGVGFLRIPAWHSSAVDPTLACRCDYSAAKIKDVTGAGNAFLGGCSAYLVQTAEHTSLDPIQRMKKAAMHGSVSASLVIEQHGLPNLEIRDAAELWNMQPVSDRLDLLEMRMGLVRCPSL